MADLTAKTVLSAVATSNSKLSELPVKDGRLIFVQDKNTIAFDFGGRRRIYKQIEEISTDGARLSILAPVTGSYYFVVETSVLWTYRDGWVQITTTPSSIKDQSDNALKDAKAYADEIGKRTTGSMDENGNVVVLFDEKLWAT